MTTVTDRVLTKVLIRMSGLPVECLTAYRGLRKAGIDRRDANLMVAGMFIGMDLCGAIPDE